MNNFQVFLSEDDAKIAEIINNREKMIETLVGIEYRTDLILDEVDEYESGEALPPDVDELRQSVRTILSDISVKDMEIMKLISGRIADVQDRNTQSEKQKKPVGLYENDFFRRTGRQR